MAPGSRPERTRGQASFNRSGIVPTLRRRVVPAANDHSRVTRAIVLGPALGQNDSSDARMTAKHFAIERPNLARKLATRGEADRHFDNDEPSRVCIAGA